MDFDAVINDTNDLLSFDLEELRKIIDIQDNISLSSKIYLSKESFQNLKTGVLKLTLKRLANDKQHLELAIIFLAKSGNFCLRYWDDTSRVIIHEGVQGVYEIHLARHSSVTIGRNTSSNGTQMILINSKIVIGEDCMFSDGVLLQSTDQHGLIDLKQKKIINDYPRTLNIGNHVWLARNTTIMPDVKVGEGSIVALGAVVTKNIPRTSIVAGVPALVVKQDMTWSRFTNNFDPYSLMLTNDYWDTND